MMKILNFPKNKNAVEHLKPKYSSLADGDAEAIDERIRSIPIVNEALFFLSHAGTEKGI
jgi:hypothetical protein